MNAKQISARPRSSRDELVTLTIDGRDVTVPAGHDRDARSRCLRRFDPQTLRD